MSLDISLLEPLQSLRQTTLPGIIGLSGISLLLSAILFRILLSLKTSKSVAYVLIITFFCLSFVSFSGNTLNLYVRGLINDLSITSLVLLIYYLFRPDTQYNSPSQTFFYIVVVTGLIFYPMALGLGTIDSYSWGFLTTSPHLLSSLLFAALISSLLFWAFAKGNTLLLTSLVLALLSFQLGLLESKNIWDYLIDPLLFIYALFKSISYMSNTSNNPFHSKQRL
ncbi:MAG: hypothetical protein GY694_06715 [Gammaproteobacteria bacterium]|nr:hypothetical protein [Gammaproteobacteria bacterium]